MAGILLDSSHKMGLAVIMLPLGWLSCFWFCRELAARQKLSSDWRVSVALATGLWGAALTLIIEAVSLFRALNATTLFIVWLLPIAALLAVNMRWAQERDALGLTRLRAQLAIACESLNDLPALAKGCWLATGLIAAFLLGIAATTPPTNWDSLCYHLPRVLHWLQQQSVEHFPTSNQRQIEFGPWAAFVQAHLFLFAGSDRWVNLPQWLAMFCSLLLVSRLAELLVQRVGFDKDSGDPAALRRSQTAGALAALFAATIPMGMMQALTPQTDYLTTMWMVMLGTFALLLVGAPDNRLYALGAGLALGLGFLTKSTTAVYAAPVLGALSLWWLFRGGNLLSRLRPAATMGLVVLLLNAPHAMRNAAVFGSVTGSEETRIMVCNQKHTLGSIASNLIRNLALHNNTAWPWLTKGLNALALRAHQLTGQRLDDPQTTYPPGPVRLLDRFLVWDDYASAPLHVFWLLLAGVLAASLPQRRKLLLYPMMIGASILLFAWLLKYQLWNSRFHLCYLVLLAPWAGLCFAAVRSAWLRGAVSLSVFLFALLCLRVNEARPIFHPQWASLPREQQYLEIHGRDWNAALPGIADAVVASGCERVGLKLNFDAFEYAIWRALRERGFKGRLEHRYVNDSLSAYVAPRGPEPELLIAKPASLSQEIVERYPVRTLHGPLVVLWQHDPARMTAAGLRE